MTNAAILTPWTDRGFYPHPHPHPHPKLHPPTPTHARFPSHTVPSLPTRTPPTSAPLHRHPHRTLSRRARYEFAELGAD
jgi:hypothetical protein